MHQHLGGCDREINSHHGEHDLLTKYKTNVRRSPLTSVQTIPLLSKLKEKPNDVGLKAACLTGWLIGASALKPRLIWWSLCAGMLRSFWVSTRAAHPARKIAKLVCKVLVHTATATV